MTVIVRLLRRFSLQAGRAVALAATIAALSGCASGAAPASTATPRHLVACEIDPDGDDAPLLQAMAVTPGVDCQTGFDLASDFFGPDTPCAVFTAGEETRFLHTCVIDGARCARGRTFEDPVLCTEGTERIRFTEAAVP